jgi:hypothetical protein
MSIGNNVPLWTQQMGLHDELCVAAAATEATHIVLAG